MEDNKIRTTDELMMWIHDLQKQAARYELSINNKRKVLAREKLNRAVSAGIVDKPEQCAQCGKQGKVQGHHADYGRPLDVVWLCIPCHGKEHGSTRRASTASTAHTRRATIAASSASAAEMRPHAPQSRDAATMDLDAMKRRTAHHEHESTSTPARQHERTI